MSLAIRLNGEQRDVREGTTVAELVVELELRSDAVAVERNGRLVRRAEHARTALEAGDKLEIVTLVGGG
jgi:sulfur carrier protein